MLTDEEARAMELRVRYWRESGKWMCAEERPDPFAGSLSRGKDWWKRSGLRGQGQTREEALKDWRSWMRTADFVASRCVQATT